MGAKGGGNQREREFLWLAFEFVGIPLRGPASVALGTASPRALQPADDFCPLVSVCCAAGL